MEMNDFMQPEFDLHENSMMDGFSPEENTFDDIFGHEIELRDENSKEFEMNDESCRSEY